MTPDCTENKSQVSRETRMEMEFNRENVLNFLKGIIVHTHKEVAF